MSNNMTASPALIRTVVLRFGLAIAFLFTVLFVPAGTWQFWEAWLYLAVLFVPMLCVGLYLLRRSPDLLERRMHVREKDKDQKRIVQSSLIFFLGVILLPGFDQRFGWSDIPTTVVLIADALVLLGYITIGSVLRENRYASRIVEVEEGQKTITTGPYGIVRHPFYVGALVFYLATPVALGSYWAALCALPLIWTMVSRIRSEEEILLRELDGYAAYVQKVRYRLVPGVW